MSKRPFTVTERREETVLHGKIATDQITDVCVRYYAQIEITERTQGVVASKEVTFDVKIPLLVASHTDMITSTWDEYMQDLQCHISHMKHDGCISVHTDLEITMTGKSKLVNRVIDESYEVLRQKALQFPQAKCFA